MSTKIKNKAVPAIDHATASKAAASFAEASHELAKKEAALNAAIQKARNKWGDSIRMLQDLQTEAAEVLEVYAKQTRADWEDKSIEIAGVSIGFRTGKRAVVLTEGIKPEDAVDNLKEAGLKRFIRIKEELDKLLLIKETKEFVLNQLAEAGITFGQSETFFVEVKQ